jgi:hypothetical protein
MSIQSRSLPDEPIIIVSVLNPIKIPDDVIASVQASAKFKQTEGRHIYRILDFTSLGQDLPFSTLVNGMVFELKADGGINDMDVSTIYVGSTEWVLFGARAFREQAQYGPTNVMHICGSVDEGIAIARADIEKKKKEKSALEGEKNN